MEVRCSTSCRRLIISNLRRRSFDSRHTYRQVQMMSKHKDPKTVMRYDHGRENMEQNAVSAPRNDEE
jgi:hypothetical protein